MTSTHRNRAVGFSHNLPWTKLPCWRSTETSGRFSRSAWLKIFALFLLFGTVLLADMAHGQTAANDTADRWLITGKTMGPVPYSVVIAEPASSVSRSQTESAIEETLERINRLMSTYQNDSDLSRFNNGNSTDWVSVDLETVKVVKRAIEIHDTIDPSFDIRVASAVERWNFGPNKKAFELPTDEEIDQLNRLRDKGELHVRLEPPAIKKSVPNLKIDLAAIAKGYAVDQVVKTISDLGHEHSMVEVGGEVYALGYRDAKSEPWRIGIERPTKSDRLSNSKRSIQAKVRLHNQALATSGNYRNYFTHDGRYYSHTIDPTTSRPVEHFLASATVVASDCMTADALATAVMVVGADQGHQLADQNQFLLFTIDRQNGFDGDLVVRSSDKFPLLDKAPDAASIWPTFVAALLIFSIAVVGMAVGAIFANKPVTGSCGGLSAMTGSGEDDESAACGVCSKPVTDCVER